MADKQLPRAGAKDDDVPLTNTLGKTLSEIEEDRRQTDASWRKAEDDEQRLEAIALWVKAMLNLERHIFSDGFGSIAGMTLLAVLGDIQDGRHPPGWLKPQHQSSERERNAESAHMAMACAVVDVLHAARPFEPLRRKEGKGEGIIESVARKLGIEAEKLDTWRKNFGSGRYGARGNVARTIYEEVKTRCQEQADPASAAAAILAGLGRK